MWDGTEACCAEGPGQGRDDPKYIRALVLAAAKALPVDKLKVGIFGWSNGGFLANRIACEHSYLAKAVVNFAGSTFMDEGRCRPTEPVHYLGIHGTRDDSIPFLGGLIPGGDLVRTAIPGAEETARRWAALNGCKGADQPKTGVFLVETEYTFASASNVWLEVDAQSWGRCAPGGSAALWKIEAGTHHTHYKATDMTLRFLRFLLVHTASSDAA